MANLHLTLPARRLAPALALAAALAASAAAAQNTAADSARAAASDSARRASGSAPVVPPAAPAPPAAPTVSPPNASPAPSGSAAAAEPRVDSLLTATARMGGRIRIRTSGVDAWAKTAGNDPKKLLLYLDGRAMQGVVAERVSGAGKPETWEVRLQRSDSARSAWEPVLGRPDSRVRNVRVGLGPAAGPEFAAAPDSVLTLGLVVARRWLLWLTGLLWLAAIAGFAQLARTTGIIRDSPAPIPPPPGDVPVVPVVPVVPGANPLVQAKRTERAERKLNLTLRPYSMARTQMAFWFILVTTSFLAIWMITGDTHGIITTQALFLIGLGAGTALAAGMVESNGREQQRAVAPDVAALHSQQQALRQASRAPGSGTGAMDVRMEQAERAAVMADTPEAPASKGFFRDILSDEDGPALHRYQHLVWTLIVGVIFVVGAYNTLALPKLDDTMLLLMGISAATYVGFKTREDHT